MVKYTREEKRWDSPMRRPVVFLFTSYATGICLGAYFHSWVGLVLILVITGASFFFSTAKYILPLSLVLLLGMGIIQLTNLQGNPLKPYENEVVTVRGLVESVEFTDTQAKLVLNASMYVHEMEQGKLTQKILISLPDSARDKVLPLVGWEISIKGRISFPDPPRNPGLFDYALYLKTKNIHSLLLSSVSHINPQKEKNPFLGLLKKLQMHYAASLDTVLSEDSKALLLGMLFGDKSLLSENLYLSFQENGTAHILAVSGIHVGILYVFVMAMFRNRKSILPSIVVLLVLFLYAALSSFSPSVTRATLMVSLHVVAKHYYQRYDLLCATSFVGFLMLLWNPWTLFHPGFQLSFLAMLLLSFLLPFTQSKLDRKVRRGSLGTMVELIRPFAPVIVFQIGMIPMMAYLFQYISLSAFFVNPPILFFAGIIIPMGMISFLLSFPGGVLFDLTGTALNLILEAMIAMNQLTSSFDWAAFSVIRPPLWGVVLFYGLLFFITSEQVFILTRNKNHQKIVALVLWICMVSFGGSIWLGGQDERAEITFVDVGQGDCIHIRTPSGKNILIDGGGSLEYDVGKKVLLPYLLKNGVSRLDFVVATHLHEDHYGGIVSLCHLLPIKTLGLFEANVFREKEVLAETGLAKNQLTYLVKGDRIQLDKEVTLEVLYPPKGEEETYRKLMEEESDENASSLILKVIYEGVSILITGDMGIEGEEDLLASYTPNEQDLLKADILKIGHHGSRFSTGDAFLEAVDPKIAIIQVGRNNFGHPHADVIEKLEKKDIIVYRNDNQGAILLLINSLNVTIETMISDRKDSPPI